MMGSIWGYIGPLLEVILDVFWGVDPGSFWGHVGSFWHRYGMFLGSVRCRLDPILRPFWAMLGHFSGILRFIFLVMFWVVDSNIKQNDARDGKNT